MNRDVSGLIAPLLALVLFVFVGWQTLGALHLAGAWTRPGAPTQLAPDDPFVLLDHLLATADRASTGPAHDPFAYGGGSVMVNPITARPIVRKPVVPAPPARPVLTAIVWASEPSAVVHWKDHDWTLHPGALFDEFQVVSITRDQVALKRGDESIILTRKN